MKMFKTAVLLVIALNASAASAQSPLGSAKSFAVLGASIVSNTGATLVTGDLGISPGTAITGFPPGIVLGGTIHAGDVVAAQAQADAGIANAQLKAMPCAPLNNLSGRILGTDVPSLPPGVYCFNTSAQLTGTLFLTGAGPWIFQIGSTLTTASNAAVVVVDAGTTCSGSNVFWQVGSSATLGVGTTFAGTILAQASITVMTGVSVSGSVLALTAAVTLAGNTVSVCAPPVVPANQPPVADAGPDRVVPFASLATLDGSASSDDGRLQTLSYAWVSDTGFSAAGKVATVFLPLGTHVFTLTVNDGEFSASDSVTMTVTDTTASAQSPLGSAKSFAVLGASIVTNTGGSLVTGDLGISPGVVITGFPPGVVLGTIHAGDVVAAQAQADAGIAYAQLKALPCGPLNHLTGRVLGAEVLSLPPGIYCFDTSAQLTGTLFLTGAGPWIFQIGSTLTTASNAAVVVADAGTTCRGANVFWQVGSSATLGVGTTFAGTILALASVTVMTGVSVSGSALALTGAVTLDANAISVCSANQAPVARAGPDQVVPFASLATLDGSASSDDGRLQTLSYAWVSDTGFSAAGQVATVLLPLGTHVFTLTVNDGEFSASDSVTITVTDMTAPAIEIASPVADAAYALDQIVFASYTCADASGIGSCAGPIENGAQLDTSSPGLQTFCVAAVDRAGNTSTRCSSYSVLEPPTITVSSPIEPIYELGRPLLAGYSCAGAATCTGNVASGGALDTSTPGLKSFTITATDAAGNTTTQVVTYMVSLGSCVAPYAGMTAWLPGDGSAVESVTGAAAIWTGAAAYGPGKAAQAFAVSNGRSLSLPFEQVGAFTLQAWVRAPDRLLPEFTGVLSTGGSAQKATSLQIELDGTGNYRLNVGDGALSWLIGPALDFFQHVAVTFDGSTLTAYLNGQLVQSEVWAGSPGVGFHVLNVGIDRDGLRPFTGLVDEVQVFNRALSNGEIAQTFLTGASGLCTNRPQGATGQSPLGSAQSFAVLGGSIVTNTGSSLITGDLGVSPATSVTGIPPGVVTGTVHRADLLAAQAQGDARIAYDQLKALTCPPVNNLTGRVLGSTVLSLPPGVYCFDTSAQLTGSLSLTGTGPWLFQIGSTLTTAANAAVVVVDAGSTCSGANVFWQVGSSATLGTGTRFAGTILALASISVMNGVSVSGSALALTGAVTLDRNNVAVCQAPPVNRPPVAVAVAAPNPAEATGPDGAIVSLDGTGSSDPDHDTLTCTWREGATLLGTGCLLPTRLTIGSHAITVTVNDGHGEIATSNVLVVVRDTTRPELTVPPAVFAEATGPLGASVLYTASATDVVSGAAPITCAPASGGAFAIGSTVVTCSATDAAGNIGSATFNVIVRDTIAPEVQITSSADAMLSGSTFAVVVLANDIVGVAAVTVNGIGAARTGGTPQAGTWVATVPVALPVAPGGVLRYEVRASDAAGNVATATLLVDNDGMPAAMDRNRGSGISESGIYSNEFVLGPTAGTLTRNGWTMKLSNAPTPGGVRATVSGSGGIARISACTGLAKEVRLDVIGETADITCASTGTITVKAISAVLQIELREQLATGTWQQFNLRTGQSMSVGSPATAGIGNVEPIDVQLMQVDDAGRETVVGSYQLQPGASVDVSASARAPGRDGQFRFKALRGSVSVTVSGRTRTLTTGNAATMPSDRMSLTGSSPVR